MIKTSKFLLCILALLTLTRCAKQQITKPEVKPLVSGSFTNPLAASYPSWNTNPIAPDQTGVTSTAVQVASRISLGFNIGNTMEAPNNEQGWGAPLITQALIDKVNKAVLMLYGFPANGIIHI